MLVGIVQAVPVNLPVTLAGCPVIVTFLPGCPIFILRRIPYVRIVAGEILPVVRSRILAVVIQFGAAVHGVFEKRTGSEFHVVLYLEIPSEQCTRLIVVHHAAVTLLAILVAPVGIVLVIIGQPVSLISAGSLLGTLCGVAPSGKVQ